MLASSLLFAALAGCTSLGADEPRLGPAGGSGSGGGDVTNVLPQWEAFTGDRTTADNSGTQTEIFTGRVRDANGEINIKEIEIKFSGVLSASSKRDIQGSDMAQLTEPATFTSDWKVWTDVAGDGVLHFKWRYTYPLGTNLGQATATPSAKDTVDLVYGPPDLTMVVQFSQVTIASCAVADDGGSSSTCSWGGWTAQPGAANVESTNYIKLTNTGQVAAQDIVIDFSDAAFVGQSDSGFSVPVGGNMQFACWEDTTPSNTAPNQGTYTFATANADGSTTARFTALNTIVYCKYRIQQLPAVLAAQAYAASFTATEV